MIEPLKKELDEDFDIVVERITKYAKKEGFRILLTKHLDDVLKQALDIEDISRYTLILACAPEIAKNALDVSMDLGMLFPCSFVVYEQEDKVIAGHISIMKIAPEIGLAKYEDMKPIIEITGKKIQSVWEKL